MIDSPLHILVIEDHPLMAQSLDRILTREGHRVAVATSGREGLDSVRRAHDQADPYAVVITDFQMQGLDGLAVAESVKQMSPLTGVILITAHLLPAGVHTPDHVDCVLAKPPKLAELRAALGRLCGDPSPT